MPAGDRTGPMGNGPMTGRALGSCAGNSATGYAGAGLGRGYGMGRGCGFGGRGGARGFGGGRAWRGFPAWGGGAPTREEELSNLENQAGQLKNALDQIQARMTELEEK